MVSFLSHCFMTETSYNREKEVIKEQIVVESSNLLQFKVKMSNVKVTKTCKARAQAQNEL